MTIDFFEKPGCINNTRQKELLNASGYELNVHDITSYQFTGEMLASFFGTMPVVEWFNYTAPAIKNGTIDPTACNAEQALSAMLKDRLLIKRPLMIINGTHVCGFDIESLKKKIEIAAAEGREEVFEKHIHADIVTCPNLNTDSCDEKKENS